MQKSFWDKLKFPIVGLSPMDGVTDAPMRFIAKKYGKPDIMYTEFVSTEGLRRLHAKGDTEHKIWRDLMFDTSERPIIAQIFGSDPESFLVASKIVAGMGFDGIDINMGCPSPGLEKRGGGAGLIRDQGRAKAVIEATREGVRERSQMTDHRSQIGEIPVSVKTRIGSKEPDSSWWKFLAEMKLPAVAMHGRTFKQLYSGEADWDVLLEAGKIIRESGAKFLPNGDVRKAEIIDIDSGSVPGMTNDKGGGRSLHALRLVEMTDQGDSYESRGLGVELKSGKMLDLKNKADGVLIGREAIGNPWALLKDSYDAAVDEKLGVAVEHAKRYEICFPESKFFTMRKHLVGYAKGFDGSSDLRSKLVLANSAGEVDLIVKDFLQNSIGQGS